MRYLRKLKELNQVEQWKLERHPLDVRDAVLDRYAREGPEAIKTVPGEVERLKWVGLYPQRQGGDAFMLRIKIPGGRLDAAQARAIGEIADTFARGPAPNPVFGDAYLDITTRQDIQLHWIRIGAVQMPIGHERAFEAVHLGVLPFFPRHRLILTAIEHDQIRMMGI